ncbi:MAG: phosphatidate cytidylyltransferase [Chlamydia sp.]
MSFSSNFLYRLLYGSLFIAATSLVLYTTTCPAISWIFDLSLYLIQYLALREFFALADPQNQEKSRIFSYLGSFCLFASQGKPEQIIGYLLLLLFILGWQRFSKIANATQSIAIEMLGAVYVTVPILLAKQLAFFPTVPISESRHILAPIPFWLIAILCIAKGSDMAAYFCGKTFGKRLLVPMLSPKKTIEGAFGGLLGSCITFWILFISCFQKPDLTTFLAYTLFVLILGAVSQVGDLIESIFKRDRGVKESSTYLPGLGGILDMMDSLIFTIPCALYLLLFLNNLFSA